MKKTRYTKEQITFALKHAKSSTGLSDADHSAYSPYRTTSDAENPSQNT